MNRNETDEAHILFIMKEKRIFFQDKLNRNGVY